MKCQIISCNEKATRNTTVKLFGLELMVRVCNEHIKNIWLITMLSTAVFVSALVFFIFSNYHYLPLELDSYNIICIILAVLSLSEIIFIYMSRSVMIEDPKAALDITAVTIFKFLSITSAMLVLIASALILVIIYVIFIIVYELILAISPGIPIILVSLGALTALVLINYTIVKISNKK